jgi:SAM-dependent methyltransferase
MSKGTRFKHVVRLLSELYEGGTALELGCGGAIYKDMFSSYVGIDLPSTPYDQGRSVDVFCDAQSLPFRDDSFDLIFTVACFCQIPDSLKTLEGCFRVLKPNGRIAIFDYNEVTTTRLKAAYDAQGNGIHCHIWSPEKLRDIVSAAGFDAEVIRDSHFWEDSGNPLKEAVKSNEIFRRLSHRLAQRKEGWNMVVGSKAPRSTHSSDRQTTGSLQRNTR